MHQLSRQPEHRPWPDRGESLALCVLVYAALALTLAYAVFWLGGTMRPWQTPLAAALTPLGAAAFRRGEGRRFSTGAVPGLAAAFWAALAFCWYVAGIFPDFSYDGQFYHMHGILALDGGWNPIYDPYPPAFGYTLHNYPKGPGIVAAGFYSLLGHIENAKLFSLLFPLAAFLLARGFLARLGLKGAWPWVAALAAAFTPTVACQIFSFYVDGQFVALLTIILLVSLEYLRYGGRGRLGALFLAGVVIFNVKFTGVVYVAVLAGGLWLYMMARHVPGRWSYFKTCLALGLIGGLVLGYNPYVTNIRCCVSPFYPMPYENVTAFLAPDAFQEQNRFSKLAQSVLARSGGSRNLMPELKLPFTIHQGEMAALGTTSQRYGGMGPLYSGALALLIPSVWLVWRRNRRKALPALGLTGLILVSVLTIGEAWYARYVPQLWLVPVIWLAALAGEKGPWPKGLAGGLAAVLLLNSALVLTAAIGWAHAQNEELLLQAKAMRQASRDGMVQVRPDWPVHRHRLEEMNLPVHWVKELDCEDEPEPLAGSDYTTMFCLEGRPGTPELPREWSWRD